MTEVGVDDAFTYIFTWRTSRDDRVCQWCDPLDGEVMIFDLFSSVLISDIGGPVWDLDADRSLLHGASGTCRCSLEVEVEVDWEQMAEFRELQENLGKVNVNISWVKERFRLSSTIAEARNQMQGFLSGMTQLNKATRETNRELTIYLALGRRIGDENITRLITLFQQGRITAEMFTKALITLTAASGPWGWLLGLGQATLASLMLADIVIGENASSEGPQ